MAEPIRKDLSVRQERAVLVGVLSRSDPSADQSLDELASLAKTAGATVVDCVVQRRERIDPVYVIGRGKVAELKERAAAHDADVIVFNHDLTPAQIREIEKATERKVIDRSELILDIFATRAQTHAARLQVELAQLEYTAPRLRGMWTHLERIAGAGGGTAAGAVGGIGTRGPGERQIEIDRRIVQKRVSRLKDQLRHIDRRKVREIRGRRDAFTVCLVGYTNAGKSTLMNALTDAGVRVEDKLFATLDTKTSRWELGGGPWALLSDTVGFVRDLPHHLVASFRATLEEAVHADLLLHVVDASSPRADSEAEAVQSVLDELGCGEKPTLMLLNKIDSVRDEALVQVIEERAESSMRISARSGCGLDRLVETVRAKLTRRDVNARLRVDQGDGQALAFLDRQAEILDRRYEDHTVEMLVRIAASSLDKLITLGTSATVVHTEPATS